MLTVTYLCPPVSGKQAKKDLRCVLAWLKRRFSSEGLEYIWFLEFTRAGSVHYHILMSTHVTEEHRIAWARYWSKKTADKLGPYCSLRTKLSLDPGLAIFEVNAHEKTWQEIRLEDGARRYIAKYAGKPHQKQVPTWYSDVGRFWGVSQGVRDSVEVQTIYPMDEDEVRERLTECGHRLASVEVLPKYIWGFPELG
jgi:hypothetical protein